MWMPGVFDKQQNAANRVLMNFEHQPGVGGVVGRGVEFRDSDEGFEGSFRMLSQQDADKALELVNEGVLTGVSLEAKPLKSIREDGVVKRVKAHLDNIALCREPAFEGAQVLAVREAPPEELEPVTVELNSDVDARLERLGFSSLVSRTVSKAPWSDTRERFTDEQWAASCLAAEKLPVLEPDGSISLEAIQRAAKQIAGGRITLGHTEKGDAARRLIRYYGVAKLDVPDSLRNVAKSL
jgi:HK97 family phage prohead protease